MSDPAKAYEKAATSLLCDCGCNPQSIKDCACGRADELRQSLAAEARTGKSGDEIIAGYVAQHGQKILVAPPASGFNLIAWTGPAIGLLGATILISLTIRRWRRSFATLPQETVAPLSPSDEAYRERLRREVRDLR